MFWRGLIPTGLGSIYVWGAGRSFKFHKAPGDPVERDFAQVGPSADKQSFGVSQDSDLHPDFRHQLEGDIVPVRRLLFPGFLLMACDELGANLFDMLLRIRSKLPGNSLVFIGIGFHYFIEMRVDQ
jgi:hypothetical protein